MASTESTGPNEFAQDSKFRPWKGKCSFGCYHAKGKKRKCKCRCRGRLHGKTHEDRHSKRIDAIACQGEDE